MASLNTRDVMAAAAIGAVSSLAGVYGHRIPSIGDKVTTYHRPVAGVLGIAAHVLANPGQTAKFGIAGMASGGAALLADYLTSYVLSTVLKQSAFGPGARALISPAVEDLLDGGPSAEIGGYAPHARGRYVQSGDGQKTLRLDM